MAAPLFTLKVGDGLGAHIGADEELFEGASVLLTPNIKTGNMVLVDGNLRTVPAVSATLDENGKLNGNTGIQLLADDVSLGLDPGSHLEWHIKVTGAKQRGFRQPVKEWSIPAGADGETVELSQVPPVVGTTAVASRGLPGATVEWVEVDAGPPRLWQQQNTETGVFIGEPTNIMPDVTAEVSGEIASQVPPAVSAHVAGLDLVERSDPGAPNVVAQGESLLVAITDGSGIPVRTWLEANAVDGGLTDHAAEMIASGAAAPIRESLGVSYATVPGVAVALGVGDRQTFLTARDSDGGPTDFWLAHMRARLDIPEARAGVFLWTPDIVGSDLYVTSGDTGRRHLITSTGTPSSPVCTTDGWVDFTTTSGLRSAKCMAGTQVVLRTSDSSTVACFGDSLTANRSGDGVLTTQRWPYVLGTLLGGGYTVANCGDGGQTAQEIAVRQGGIVLQLAVSGGSIPTSGGVTVTPTPTIVWRTELSQTYAGSLAGVTGVLSRSGDTLTFTRSASGSAVSVASAPFIATQSVANASKLQILWSGRNDIDKATGDVVGRIVAADALMVDRIEAHAKLVLVLGPTNATTEVTGTTGHGWAVDTNAALAEIYADRYLDIRSFIIHDALAAAGITPTSGDLAAIASDTPPPSLMADTIHFNAACYAAIAQRIYNKLDDMGWI